MLGWLHITQMSDSHMMELQKAVAASRYASFIARKSITDSKSCKCDWLVCWWFCINGAAEASEQAFCTVGKRASQWRRVALGLRHLLISGGKLFWYFLSLTGSKQISKVWSRSHLLGLDAGAEGGTCDALVPVASNTRFLEEKCSLRLLFIQRHLGLARTFVQDLGLKTRSYWNKLATVFRRLSARLDNNSICTHAVLLLKY